MEKMKRILSFALCLCMLLSMSPLAALAEGEEIPAEMAEISEIVPEIEVVPEEIAIVELTEEEVSTEAEVVEEVPAEAEVEVPAEAEVVEEISAEAEVPAEAEVVEEAPVEAETAEEVLTETAEEIPEEAAEEVIGGTCGEELTWVLENGTLTISGSGRMNNYTRGTAPWYAYCSEITGVVFTGSVTYIGTFAFADCAALAQVNIDLTAVELGACAFDGTAVEPPTSEEVEVVEEAAEEVEAVEEVIEETEAVEEVTEEVEVAEEVVEETEAAEEVTEEVEVAEEAIEETEIIEENAQETEAAKEIAEEIEVAEDVPTQTEVDEEFVIEIEADDAVPAETEAAEIVEEAAEEVTAETEYNSEADTAPAEKTKEEPEAVIGGSPYNQVIVPGYKLPVSLMDEVVPTQAQAYNAMIALKSTYPEGYSLTDDNFKYYWNGGIYTYGTGCAGFAFKLSDAAFGTLPARKVTPVSISNVHVGDILRINNDCHSVIILEVYSDHVVVAEGNYNSSVHWGRTLTAAEVAAANYNMTRYPVGTFSDTTYTISYNANGGDGAPSSQVKSKGEPIVLSTAIPTRLFYEFKGWATSATATTATYQPGASYTKDASATLYAVWAKASYPKMVIGDNTATISNPGAYAAFQFTPSSTGTYVFQSDYDGDTMAVLYQSNGTKIAEDDDSGNGYNFKIKADLTSGQTYILTTQFYSEYLTDSFIVNVHKLTAEEALTVSVNNPVNTESSIYVSWEPVSGAANYRVFVRAGSGSWTTAGTTANSYYVYTSATPGTRYSFYVRALKSDGSYLSTQNSNEVSIIRVEAPDLVSATNTSSGIALQWNAARGAASYHIWLYIGNNRWTLLGSTTGTSYTVSGLAAGQEYTLAIEADASNDHANTSTFSNEKTLVYNPNSSDLPTPVLTGVSNAVGGVTVKWNAVPGAAKYRVYYKGGSVTSWTKAVDTTGTSATITGLTSGTKYSFTVRCLSADSSSFTSSYDSTGKSITYIAAPTVSSVANAANGVTVKWAAVPGAVNYRVFYKTGSTTSWTGFGTTTGTSLTVTGLTSGTKYSFTVRCVTADGKSYTSAYDSTGKSITYAAAKLATPVLSGVSNAVGGVTVKWNAVSGAAKYRVFYKTGSGSWVKAADTAATSYTVTGLTSGTKYTFTVRCITSDGSYTSDYDTVGKSLTYVAAPAISSVANAANGVTVKWGAVAGAVNYRVYYKVGSGSWTGCGTTTGTSMTVTGLTSGTKYTFTVRCVSADGKSNVSYYDGTGKTITYIAAPVLSSVANAANGVTVKWGAVTGAAKYRVFYKVGSGSWVKAADTTSTSYAVTGLTSGTKYTFTVRCISADGSSYTSNYDATGKSITYTSAQLATPVLTSVTNAVGGVTVKWNAVSGAAQYRVFYKVGSGSWVTAKNTTSTSATVTGLTSGTKYTFTVRCLSADGKSYTSGYDATGKSITYVAAPAISSVSNASNGVTVKWGAVAGASNYRVFYKVGSGSWVTAKNTTSTSATITGLTSGTKYTFTVRCLSADGASYISAYDATGKSITYTPTSGTVLSGKVGDNVTATLSSDGTLRLSGTGTTYNYYEDGTPWSNKEDGDKILRVVVGSGVTTIGANIFSDLENLQSATFANTVTTLRSGCFENCRALTSVTLPTSLTEMDSFSFRGCYSLAKITLPDSLRYIDGNPFTWDNVQITVSANHPYLEVVNGVLFQKVEKKLIYYPVGSASTSYTIPTGTKVVASEAFSSANNLKSISIPNTVVTLEMLCFGNCRSLTSLTVPASVTSFGSMGYSENLETVTFLGNAPEMYNFTFESVGTVTIRYKSTASGWTSELKSSLQGDIIWSAY